LREVYAEAGVDPSAVVYVEAHATGTRVGDPQEANAIAEVLCAGHERETPLLVGSVKTNIGHAELASGLMSIVKVIISIQRGCIPKNLHYNQPNPYVPGLMVSRI
jgi:fatty acid synthase